MEPLIKLGMEATIELMEIAQQDEALHIGRRLARKHPLIFIVVQNLEAPGNSQTSQQACDRRDRSFIDD